MLLFLCHSCSTLNSTHSWKGQEAHHVTTHFFSVFQQIWLFHILMFYKLWTCKYCQYRIYHICMCRRQLVAAILDTVQSYRWLSCFVIFAISFINYLMYSVTKATTSDKYKIFALAKKRVSDVALSVRCLFIGLLLLYFESFCVFSYSYFEPCFVFSDSILVGILLKNNKK